MQGFYPNQNNMMMQNGGPPQGQYVRNLFLVIRNNFYLKFFSLSFISRNFNESQCLRHIRDKKNFLQYRRINIFNFKIYKYIFKCIYICVWMYVSLVLNHLFLKIFLSFIQSIYIIIQFFNTTTCINHLL